MSWKETSSNTVFGLRLRCLSPIACLIGQISPRNENSSRSSLHQTTTFIELSVLRVHSLSLAVIYDTHWGHSELRLPLILATEFQLPSYVERKP